MADHGAVVDDLRVTTPEQLEDEPMTDDESFNSDDTDDSKPRIVITLTHRGKAYTREFPSGAVFEDLTFVVDRELGIEESNQKYMVAGFKGLLKGDRDEQGRTLRDFEGKKITLIGTETKKIESFQSAEKLAADRQARRRLARREAGGRPRRRNAIVDLRDASYGFSAIKPLPNLPDPARSQQLLERLSRDPGIKAAMRKHRLSVGLLTEMEPLSNTQTTHEGTTRLLGLNRNQGMVIELRLWTDAYDGYRDYNTIRKTLCHELAHNRHGPHDRTFWDFCHEIERDVHAAATGHTTGEASFMPSSEDDVDDHGGWTGGSFVLGSGASNEDTSSLSRREILARAAELRRRRMDDDDPNGGNQGSSSS